MKKLNIRVSSDLDQQLTQTAAAYHLSKNELINLILKSYLGNVESKELLETFSEISE